MGIMNLKIKIMPKSVETDLKELTANVKKIIEGSGGKNTSFQEEPIAFGLKALIVSFLWPEEKELQELEDSLTKANEVNSIQIIDMRKTI